MQYLIFAADLIFLILTTAFLSYRAGEHNAYMNMLDFINQTKNHSKGSDNSQS